MTRPVRNVQTRDGRVAGFDTERLTARPLEPSDASWLAELHRDPHVMATIGGIRTDAESAPPHPTAESGGSTSADADANA